MSLEVVSESAVAKILTSLEGVSLSDVQKQDITSIVENALREAANQCHQAHNEVTVQCCGHEADMAHKIAEQSRLKTDALISNLMALR
ncbi:MAG: DUF2604 domain-containing protein [Pseudomonadota bacterium]